MFWNLMARNSLVMTKVVKDEKSCHNQGFYLKNYFISCKRIDKFEYENHKMHYYSYQFYRAKYIIGFTKYRIT